MRQKRGDEWYPFWVDKWLFGSTRIEFSPAQRAVWIDLLTLSKKDDGFIRANEDAPYPIEQLAGLFRVKPSLLLQTITKAIEVKKLEKLPDGTLYVVSTPDYQLSERHKRRLESGIEKDGMSANPDAASEKADAKNRIEESREEKKRKEKSLEKKRASPFTPPSAQEVQEYTKEIGYALDCQQFVDFYKAKGWKIGKEPMKDWKAAVRTWQRRDKQQHKETLDEQMARMKREGRWKDTL